MAVLMKLQYVDSLSGGRKRFRKRYPEDVKAIMGRDCFQMPMSARDGSKLVAEQEALLRRYNEIVRDVRRKGSASCSLSKRDQWKIAADEVKELIGLDEDHDDYDETRVILAEHFEETGGDPKLYQALAAPPESPPYTLLDAKNVYREENLRGAVGRNQKDRLEGVCRRLQEALGPLVEFPLANLRMEHAKAFRDVLLAARKSNGEPLAISSIQREQDMVRAMVQRGIVDFDLQLVARNPFAELRLERASDAPKNAADGRLPLPDDVIVAMRGRLSGPLRRPELRSIWTLLEGTGCRGAEIVGLRCRDIVLDGGHPHIRVEWNEDRRLKTAVSIRSVPLLGRAYEAAKEALREASGAEALFPRYTHETGPDAVSAALNKHLREITDDKRHVVYSLRHNMKDWLVKAGVTPVDQNRILGHSQVGVGDTFYGGDEAKLKASSEAVAEALKYAPR